MPLTGAPKEDVKREVYLCYDKTDEFYRREFDSFLADSFVVKNTEIPNREKMGQDQYTSTLLGKQIINSQTVLIVLVGNDTSESHLVDWEIFTGLKEGKSDSLDSYCAMVALLVPGFKYKKGKQITRRHKIPKRLLDNIDSKYCKIYPWTYSRVGLQKIVNEAYLQRNEVKDQRVNTAHRLERPAD